MAIAVPKEDLTELCRTHRPWLLEGPSMRLGLGLGLGWVSLTLFDVLGQVVLNLHGTLVNL